jgi:hypothetical protein
MLLLSAALRCPEKLPLIAGMVCAEDFRDGTVREAFGRLAGSKDGSGPESVLAGASDEVRALISRLSLNPGFDPDHLDDNIEACITRIKGRIEDRIMEAKNAGDLESLIRLTRERQKILTGG